jgi:RNA polymerase sigma-B factor
MLREASEREQIDLDLLRRYHDHRDLQARELLAERCLPLVRSIARRYVNRGEEFEDLEQSGMVGLVKAIERYDVSTGHRFVSFAVPNIQGEIRRHFRDRSWAVHVPRSVQELHARLQVVRTELESVGEPVTVDALAQRLEATPEEVRDAQSAGRSYRALSLDGPAGDEHTVGGGRGRHDEGYARVDDRDVLDRAMVGLDARTCQILRWRFRDDLLQREIAERVGVSQMQVSRIIKAALVRMGAEAVEPGPIAA